MCTILLLYGRTARHSFEICSFRYSAWKLKNPFFLKTPFLFIGLLRNIGSYSDSSNSFLPLGLKQLENSFSFLLNNRKKQCEACNNIVQPNSGALPVHLDRLFLSTVTFLTEILLVSGSRLCIFNCMFQLDCVWDCLIFRNGSFCFVLFCFVFLWKWSFRYETLNELSTWFLNALLDVSGYFHLGALQHLVKSGTN